MRYCALTCRVIESSSTVSSSPQQALLLLKSPADVSTFFRLLSVFASFLPRNLIFPVHFSLFSVSKLDPKEKVKEAGDAFFKAANFEKAAVEYTKCLNSISDKVYDRARVFLRSLFLFCCQTL